MKNFLLLALLSFFAIGCGDDIETNTPSIQGEVEGIFFRSENSSAVINNDDESLTLTGVSSDETVTLKVSAYEEGVYMLGGSVANEATFEDFNGSIYLTGTDGEGRIEITRIEGGTVSGEFYFNALENGVGDTINFSKGSFFDVPVTNPTPPAIPGPEVTCEEAQILTATAQTAYDNVDVNDAEQVQVTCNAYRAALNQEIDICGDEDGSLQTILDTLGDCEN